MFAITIRETLPLLYQVACRMALAQEDRVAIIREAFGRVLTRDRPPPALGDDLRRRLLRATAEIAQQQQRLRPQLGFEALDDLLRDEPTNPEALRGLTDGDQERLLWELKQGCLTAVVACLPPGERIAFVLLDLLGLSADEAAEVLDIKASALRVRASRGRNKIVDYLCPRCGHVNARNPCRCPSRLGVALQRGFIGPVSGRRVALRKPFDEAGPQHEPLAIYHGLPAVEPPRELLGELLNAHGS